MHNAKLQPLTRYGALALLTGAALAGSALAQGAAKPPQLTTFATQARVEIDASGKVVSVAPDPKLLPLVADAVRSTVAALVFEPARRDGQPVGGVTHVHLGACAAPVDDGFRLAIKYHNHGPGRVGASLPQYPAALLRPGMWTRLQLDYRVEADGTAVVENLDVDRGNARDRGAARAMMQQWLDGNRFEPELVGGMPVATRVSMPIEIIAMKKTMASRSGPAREAQALMQAKALQATTCQAALAEASKKDRTLVRDSPFKLLPAG